MQFPSEVTADTLIRLRRLEGQIRGIQRLVDEGADCEAIVTQLSAAKGALDRVSFRLMAAGMQHCARAEADGAEGDDLLDAERLEKLFLKLA